MHEHGQTLVFLITLFIFALVMMLIRKKQITERFANLWIIVSLLLLLASSVGFPYLFKIAVIFGIPYPPSALFLLVIFGLILLVIELFTWVSKLNERTRILAQRLAILSQAIDKELMSRNPSSQS